MLENRISDIDGFPLVEVKVLYGESSELLIRSLLDLEKQKQSTNELKKKFDASMAEPEEIRLWLERLPVEGVVSAVWPAFREAVIAPYKVWVEYYDDLWYPSSDDVLITDESYSFLLELSHEEIFTYYE